MLCVNFVMRIFIFLKNKFRHNKNCSYIKSPLRAGFQIEILRKDGTLDSAYITTKYLTDINGQLFIEGRIEVAAYYRMLPVKQIMVLCDCATGEHVSRPALPHWLRHRVRRALFQCG